MIQGTCPALLASHEWIVGRLGLIMDLCKSLGQNSPLFVIGVVLKEVGILVNGDKYIYIRYGQCERQVSAKTTYKQDTAVRKKGRFIYHSLVGWVCQKYPFLISSI